jgi:hypothetical protein
MNRKIFWVVTPCISEAVRRLKRAYVYTIYGSEVSQARNQEKQAASSDGLVREETIPN